MPRLAPSILCCATIAAAACAPAAAQRLRNAYRNVILVSNLPELKPQILDPLLLDGWGITIRPPGAGGHFWITNTGSGTTTTYVGDVPGVPLYQDELKVVIIPSSILYGPHPQTISQPTGQVYAGRSTTDFQIIGEEIAGASKFIFVTLDGAISGWRDGMNRAVNMVDDSLSGAMFTGIAITEEKSNNRIYVCDFGLEKLRCWDAWWNEVPLSPGAFVDPRCPGYYTPWNIQYLEGRLYIMWARQGDDPGEEDQYPGYGYVSSFDLDGNLLTMYEHRNEMNAPWGVAIAPHNFGALSGALLVGNFADGRILAYDLNSGAFIDFMRDEEGEPVVADGLWGMLFGNGVRLGRTNHLYYAAGPNLEIDGVFGKFEPVTPISPDLDDDGAIGPSDIDAIVGAIGPGVDGDLDGDGATTLADLAIVLEHLGAREPRNAGR